MSTGCRIWHNPKCSKSRQTLKLLEDRGIEHTVYKYLEEKPTAADIEQVITKLGIEPRQLLRKSEASYKSRNLEDKNSDLITAMVSDPILIERPIVVTTEAARVGRPPERVLEIL